MPADFPVPTNHADTSIDALDRAIVTLAARINSATYDLLILIRRFDERGGWLRWGFESCADWLHWRCDLSLSAAREKDYRDAWFFRRHDGRAVPACGYRAADRTDDFTGVGKPVDVQPCAEGLAVIRRLSEIPMVREPSAEGYFTSMKKLTMDGRQTITTRETSGVAVGMHPSAEGYFTPMKKFASDSGRAMTTATSSSGIP